MVRPTVLSIHFSLSPYFLLENDYTDYLHRLHRLNQNKKIFCNLTVIPEICYRESSLRIYWIPIFMGMTNFLKPILRPCSGQIYGDLKTCPNLCNLFS